MNLKAELFKNYVSYFGGKRKGIEKIFKITKDMAN